MVAPLARRLLAEFLGTGLLVAVVIGSGIAAQQLSPTDVGLQLLQNSLTTVFGLGVLILLFGPVSGAHFNPVVSAVDWAIGRRAGTGLTGSDLAAYTVAQILGGIGGALLANIMFGLRRGADLPARPRRTWAVGRRDRRHRRTDRAHPHPRPHRPREPVGRRGRRLDRRRLLVHLLHQLRQPRRHHRPHVQRHLRGHRPRLRAPVRRLPSASAPPSARAWPCCSTPTPPPPPTTSWSPTPPTASPRKGTPDELGPHHANPRAGTDARTVPQVLFVCVHNAGRSQMAAALLQHHAAGRVDVRSAGSTPADEINPAVRAAMAEIGIDLDGAHPKLLTTDAVQASDVVVTMGCGDTCPVFPGKRYLDWDLTDPAGKTLDQIRPIRDDIDQRVRELLAKLDV